GVDVRRAAANSVLPVRPARLPHLLGHGSPDEIPTGPSGARGGLLGGAPGPHDPVVRELVLRDLTELGPPTVPAVPRRHLLVPRLALGWTPPVKSHGRFSAH